jgi:hypothetical protein
MSVSSLWPKITYFLKVVVRRLEFYFCGAPSLTRGRVCSLQCNHSMVRVTQNTWPYFTDSSETPPTWRTRFPYLYLPGTGWRSYTPGHLVPFTLLLRLAVLWWRYSNPPPHRNYATISYIFPLYNQQVDYIRNRYFHNLMFYTCGTQCTDENIVLVYVYILVTKAQSKKSFRGTKRDDIVIEHNQNGGFLLNGT